MIVLDCYNDKGNPDKKMLQVIQTILKAIGSDSQISRISGFTLSTALPVFETLELLKSAQIQPKDFDALICSSGSEIYYPGTYLCTEQNGKFSPDPDYAAHIEYRWGHEGVKRTIERLMNSQDGEGGKKADISSLVLEEDLKSSNSHCVSFLIKDPTKVRPVDELRQKLRMRGLRSHIMYCRNSTRLQVIPLLASRSQALRYFFVRWGLNVANMCVILGERGDTDHAELISGCHKTIIMKGIVETGSEELIRTKGNYQKDDNIPGLSPLVVHTSRGIDSGEIMGALKEVYKAGSGM